jgi:heat shock protein HtpX
MPYSFTQIEKDKTTTIGFVFSFLILFYFVSFWLLIALGMSYLNSDGRVFEFQCLNGGQSLVVFGIALVIGYGHWSYATSHLIIKILGVIKAEVLNSQDTYHQQLKNIVEEVSVATGGTKMEPVVISTMAMNAFAVADFSGRAVIGVTEGMLARLTRAQLEAVVGHEAAHIVTGDCLATTITSSLFELYSGILKGFEVLCRSGSSNRRYSSVSLRGGAQGAGFLMIIYVLLVVTKSLSHMARLFISRQREYRADAIAVRLTRDPLSLAEALYAITYRWRGAGLPAQELEAIFTVNPVHSSLDEQKGLWADMFSTHPPVEERIGILLNMAHTDAESFIKEVERKAKWPRLTVVQVNAGSKEWLVQKDGEWKGPFNITQFPALDWITPETWIQTVGEDKVKMVYEDQDLQKALYKTELHQGSGVDRCPRCQAALQPLVYEGVEVYQCGCCRGALVGEHEVPRIIIRQEVGFSDQIRRIAAGIRKEEKTWETRIIQRDPKLLLTCPHCHCRHIKAKMLRMFYTEAYRIEIDKCHTCGMIWFDKDELELLQYMIEDTIERV